MDELRRKALAHTFEQFSDNQKYKEQSFIRILGFLGAVVFGYAFVYQKYLTRPQAYNFLDFSLISTAAILLLTGGAWLIIAIGYSFRRDQHIMAKIKKSIDIIGKQNYFSWNYNPLSIYCLKKSSRVVNLFIDRDLERKLDEDYYKVINLMYIRWLPDTFIIYYGLFPVFSLIITSLFIYEIYPWIHGNIGVIYYIFAIVDIVLTFETIYFPLKYSKKLLRRLLVWNNLIEFGELSSIDKKDRKIIMSLLDEIETGL